MIENSSVSFSSVLEAAGIKNPDEWKLEITDVDKFKRKLYATDGKNHFTKVIHLQKLNGETILNIATKMIVDNLARTEKPKDGETRNDHKPRNGQDFFDYMKANEMRLVREFQDSDGNQWVVYENPRPAGDQRNEAKPEPDYWVTGDALDWEPGYQFNGSRWLIQKIQLDDQERMVIQNIVHDDIKENQFEFTNSKNPFAEIKKLVKKPTHNSVWRLYQSIDDGAKFKHWIDIIAQPAYDRYYYKGRPLYFIVEKRVDNLKNQVTVIEQDSVDLADFGVKPDNSDKEK